MYHEEIQINHGPKDRWCFDCHNADDRDHLRLVNGTLVGFRRIVQTLRPVPRHDLPRLARGNPRSAPGLLDGAKSYLLCAHCHNPHAPAFQPIEPLPPRAGRIDSGERDIVVLNTAPRVYDLTSVEAGFQSGDVRTDHVDMAARELHGRRRDSGRVVLGRTAPRSRRSDHSSIIVDREAIRQWLTPIEPQIRSVPKAARFDYAFGYIESLSPAEVGGILDIDGSIERAIEAAYTDVRFGELAVQELRTRVGSDSKSDLQGVKPVTQVHVGFEGAPPSVMANLTAAAARMDGTALAPNQTFSFNDELGAPRLLEGIEPAILGLPADGFGHAATAAYRAALLAGLPIIERHAPAARVGWYEPPIGLDASVLTGERDLQFTNDTGDWILFEVEVDARRMALSWNVYAKAPKRTVRLVGPTVLDVSAAPDGPAETRVSTELALGASLQAGWAREGARVVVERIVTAKDGVRRDMIESDYAPAADLMLIGGGTP